jgi:P-type Ca2+ transporter type 2C
MRINWHALEVDEIFKMVDSSEEGLPTLEAGKRLRDNGSNSLPGEKGISSWRLFFTQFHSTLAYIILFAVVVSLFLGHVTDALFIFSVLLINALVGFFQENKVNKSLQELKQMVRVETTIIRDGKKKELDSEDIVVGDIVSLKSGDKVPADCRLIRTANLKINEASLTGEWLAVEKGNERVDKGLALAERSNMAYMGTIVEEGEAMAVVVNTAMNTEIGQIVSLLKQTKEEKTPLQKKIAILSKYLGGVVIFAIVIISALGFISNKPTEEIFILAVALTVSAIPEGLLPAITVILVLGMRRILKDNGLVRKLSATETLGSVTVICTDKTGTLTEGKMEVSHILTSTKELLGHEVRDMAKDDSALYSHITMLKIATLCNEAYIENPDDELHEWIIRGNLTQKALLLAGTTSGLKKAELEMKYPLIERIPFSSVLKFSATLHQAKTGKVIYAVGAPEQLIQHCQYLDVDGNRVPLEDESFKNLLRRYEELTAKGLRVIACAQRDVSRIRKDNLHELLDDLVLVGFIALKDPLRSEVKEAIALTEKAGIKTIIITGDHKLTVQAIAKDLGMHTSDAEIMEGKDLDKISDNDLYTKVKSIRIFARVSPTHKLRIVNALKAHGEIVAMIGDGVNDSPALKTADIGVAVGSGTDVAKEVADLVLLDDSFSTIVKAVEQGRIIFNNIRKVLIYFVADHSTELFLFFITMALGLPAPLFAAQILWINLVQDGILGIALTTDQEKDGIMSEKPRSPIEPLLSIDLKKWLLAISLISGLASFLVFGLTLSESADINLARTMAFALMSFDSLLFIFSVSSFKSLAWKRKVFANLYLVGAAFAGLILLILALYFPPLQKLLSTQQLNVYQWFIVVIVALLEFILIELCKGKFVLKEH